MLDVKLDDAAKELVDEANEKLVPALSAMLQATVAQLLDGLDGFTVTLTVARKPKT